MREDLTENIALNLIPYRKGLMWGFCDNKMQTIIPAKYQDARPFSEGLAAVKLNDKYGFIDMAGITVIPFLYDFASDFKKDIAFVIPEKKEGGEFFQINKKNDVIGKGLEFKLSDNPSALNPKRVEFYKKDYGNITEFYYEDKNGLYVKGPFDFAWPFTEGIGIAHKAGIYFFINEEGKEIFSKKMNRVSYFNEGYASAKFDKSVGFIDHNGNEFKLDDYSDVRNFYDGLAAVERDDRWGFLDKNFKEVIKPIYDKVGDFENGIALVKHENREGYIDCQGNQYWED